MNATNTFVKNVDHHLDNIEYHLGHMRRRSTASTPYMQSTAPLKIPKEHAPYRGGESQYTSGSYLPPNLNRRPAATNRPPVSVSSPLHPSQAKRQRGGNGSDEKRRGIVPFAAEARSSKFAARRRPLRSLSSTSLLLSSSSSTLISSSSSSSRSPSPRPRRGTLTSSISSTLTSATLISFSSLEESPAGEIGTRWLQWRRAAYHLLASHYEKCHGVLTSSARQELQGNYRKKNISHASKKEDYEERRSPTSASESSDSLDDLIHEEQSLRRYRSTVKVQAAATKDDGASASEQLARGITEEEPTSRHTLDKEVALRERQRRLALQEELAAAARAEVQRKCLRLEEEESNQRSLIEQDEAEELVDVLEAVDADAEEAAQRMARRVRKGSVSLEPSLLAYSLLHTDIASKCEDKSVQTPQSVKKVNATQTEIYVSAQMESPEGGDELHCETKSWRQLYLLSQLTQTGESELCATVASQTNIGSEVRECGANELNGDVVLGHLTQRRTKCVQTPPPRNASVQASDGTVSAANHGQKSTESRVAVETLDLMFGEQVDPLHTRVESRRRTSSGWQQGDALLPRNDDDDARPSKNSTHTGVVALSNASSDGCEEEKEEKGKSADGPVEERPVLEKDSFFSHTPEPQVSPSASRVPSKITIVKDAVSSPSSIIARQKIPSFPRSVRTLPGSLARRRHVELAASSVGAYPYLRESWTNEDEQLAGSSHWGLEAFDFDWSSDAPLDYSAFRDIMRLEARHRRHVERHESLERNEIRWDELSHYRASVRWNDAVAGVVNEARKTTKEEEEEETENGNENEETPSWGNPRLLAPDSVVASDADASSWQHVADDAVDEKENILPQTDVPQPTDPVKRKSSSTAWCVDMGGGASSGVPPHLRNSPWAPMLTRRTSRSSSKSLLSAMGQVTSQLPRRYRRPPKLNSGNEKVVCPNTQCSDMVCAAPLQRASENALGKKTVAFPGYTQQFERRLVWQQQQQQQQQNAYGLSSHHPPYCRATVSFLESAEWRYQKIYVDQYLYASPCAERRDGTFRKCTDAICEEVGRAYNT